MSEAKQQYKIEGRPSTIYRVVKSAENPYVMIDRRPIDNVKLSWKAKGILTYLMSRPDGWEVSVTDLVNHSTDGTASARAGLKELKKAGHMKYTKMRQAGRITGWLIEVYEVPDSDFLHVEKLHTENQHIENRTQVLKNLSNTENNKKRAKAQPEFTSELKIYREVTKRNPHRANYADVTKIIQSVSARLGRECTAEDLQPFFSAWTGRGFNPSNINWTSWAVTGNIPQQGKQNSTEFVISADDIR